MCLHAWTAPCGKRKNAKCECFRIFVRNIFECFPNVFLFLLLNENDVATTKTTTKAKKRRENARKKIEKRPKTHRKMKTKTFVKTCIVSDILEKLRHHRALHTSPCWSKKEQEKKTKCVMTIKTVTGSSKSKLSSWGKRPFKVFGLWRFFLHWWYFGVVLDDVS